MIALSEAEPLPPAATSPASGASGNEMVGASRLSAVCSSTSQSDRKSHQRALLRK